MRAASSLSARSARRLYVASVSRSWPAGLTSSRSVFSAAARTTTERLMRRMSPPPPPPTASLTTAAAASAASTSSSPSAAAAAAFSLYSHPSLYDAAFAFRDFDAEAQFLVDAWETYGGGGGGGGENKKASEPLSSFLDIGAGTGRHGAALARLLLSSEPSAPPLSLFALDSNAEMLAAASRSAAEAGCPLKQAIEADMTRGSFNICERVQVALCALGTLAHALPATAAASSDFSKEEATGPSDDDDPALRVLRAASAALVPGGVLVLELPAAGDLFDGTLLAGDAWDVPAGAWQRGGEGGGGEASGEEKENGEGQQQQPSEQKRRIGQITKPPQKKKVSSSSSSSSSSSPALIVEYGSPDDDFDPVSQVLHRTVVVSEAKPDGSAGREVGRETVAQRLFSPAEVRALAREAGFRVAAELGDMEIGGGNGDSSSSSPPPLTAQEGDRYVAVLVKK